jgi:hypothetical protein
MTRERWNGGTVERERATTGFAMDGAMETLIFAD